EDPEGSSVTVVEADDRANRFANALLSAGAEPGQILVMICDNSLEAVLAKIGAAKAGVTVAPLNPNLSPEVMEQLIADLGAEWAIVDAEFAARVKPVLENAQVRALVTVAVGGPQPEESVSFRE